jgi:hypothetical protein
MKIQSRVRGSTFASHSTRERLNRLAWLLDDSIAIPGIRFRIGLDALLGLIPGIGDALGVLVSSYILREAAQLGVPKTVLIKMAFNVAIEGVIGMIPFAGDLFDAAWKANQRNVRLLNAYLDDPRKTTGASARFAFVLAVLVIGFLVGTGVVGFLIVRWIWHAIGAY